LHYKTGRFWNSYCKTRFVKKRQMKKLATLFSIVLGLNLGFTQETVNITINGISPETEKSIIPGDQVSFFEFEKGGYARNVIVKVKTSKGTKRIFGSFDVKPDGNGHYTFSETIEIKESSNVTFNSDIKLLISMPTIFGNAVWTEVIRTKETLTDPIVLDRYSEKAGTDLEPRKRLNVNFSAIAYDDKLKNKVNQQDDSWRETKKEDFHFYLKNEGDEAWKIDQVMKYGTKSGYTVSASLPYNDELDLNKMIVMRVEVTTVKKNILWDEVSFKARGMTEVFFGNNYQVVDHEVTEGPEETGTIGSDGYDSDDDNPTIDPPTVDESDADPVVESTTENGTESNSTETGIVSSGTITTTTTTIGTIDNGGATDLTTKTTEATCAKLNPGDSLVTVNGSKVCIRGFKGEGAKAMVGTLALDCNFEINGTIFPIKGNEKIKCNKADGKLVEGTLRANTTFNSSAGVINLREGSVVKFQGEKLIGGSLAENASIEVGGKTVVCAPNQALEYDIRFDVQGRYVEGTLANPLLWGTNTSFTFPEMSRLVYKNGVISKVICQKESSFDLNGKTINVLNHNALGAYEFSAKGELTEVNSAAGNMVVIEDQSVPVKEGTKIKFELVDGTYQITKFFAASQVTLNVYKGKSTKSVTVKAGKKVVLKDGKVVKAG
jgi:hypothetical protein